MITITDSAKKQIKDLCENNSQWGIKLAVKGGGCAGFQYDWSFVNSQDELERGDEIIDIEDKKFVIDGVSLMYVLGTTLDYKKEIFGSNFTFENPNATSSCGCGTSFAL